MTRIGILGGTFDPPHVGHLAMARKASEVIGLDQVWLMPSPNPPHKSGGEITAYPERLQMVRIAVADEAGVGVSRLEEDRGGVSYTADLLNEYGRRHPEHEVYFIIGADNLRDLASWKTPHRILEQATLVVFPRDGIEMRLDVDGEASLVVFEEPVIDISSREIRRRCAKGESIDGLVDPRVADFIRDHKLYRS